MRRHVRLAWALILALGPGALAGCAPMTVEEARALCNKEGGMLTVFSTQEVSLSGKLGPEKDVPGNCVHREAFGAPAFVPPVPPASQPAPVPAAQ
jgi:hypothetical protein